MTTTTISSKYKGKFDQGWDKLREETFARQKKLGVIPPDCELTPRHKEILDGHARVYSTSFRDGA